jgi:hypothetical protein
MATLVIAGLLKSNLLILVINGHKKVVRVVEGLKKEL